LYVVTPNGQLILYDYETHKTIPISKDMPSDPKHPKPLNENHEQQHLTTEQQATIQNNRYPGNNTLPPE
jgi:hypothetical protein